MPSATEIRDRSPKPAGATRVRPRPLPALTGLRFFLAAQVLLFHFSPEFFGHSRFARNFVAGGSSAVGMFFLLSGLILTYVHVDERGRLDQRSTGFWLARFLRIYPVYLLAFLIKAPFGVIHLRHSAPLRAAGSIAAFLFLLQTWIPGLWNFWNGPAWSLSVEAFFYALFPLLVVLLGRRRRESWWLIAGAIWIAGTAAPALMRMEPGSWLLLWPPPYLSLFVLGMLIGGRLLDSTMAAAASNVGSRVASWMAACGALGLIGGLGCGFSRAMLDHGLLAPLALCLMWGLARGNGPLTRALAVRPIVYLGDVSYGIYILQQPVFTWCYALSKRFGIPWGGRLSFLAAGAVLVALSALSFEWMETPVRRFGMLRYREYLARNRDSAQRSESRADGKKALS